MPFSFGTPKTATGFTLPTTTTTAAGGTPSFQFSAAGGDAKITKPPVNLTFAPSTTGAAATAASTAAPTLSGFSFTGPPSTPPQFNLGTSTAATTSSSLSFSLTTATSAPTLSSASTGITVSAAPTTSTPSIFSLGASAPKPTVTSATTSITAIATTTPTTTTLPVTSTSLSTTATTPAPTTLTYSQLEDMINKWTVYLEDESKQLLNQAKQLNAWDRLLIMNGEKILFMNNSSERVKELQDQLDQELDFVIAQQKELGDLIAPLEKEVLDLPITDADRQRTYQLAETMDTQLKQMSEDLKEIIEHLNESNKIQELANPVFQVSRILNVHMDSLQWIDRNTTKIISHLEQVAKMQEENKREYKINLHRSYE